MLTIALALFGTAVGCKPRANPYGKGQNTVLNQNLDPGPLPESMFQCLKELDKDRIAAKLEEYDAPFEPQPRPAGMDDEVYARCQRMFVDKSVASDLMSVGKEETGELNSFGFIENKYLATLGDKLTVWRLSDKKRIRDYELPEGVHQLLIGKDIAHAILASKKKIYKLSFADSKIKAEVEVPEGIAAVDLAYESGHVAVCTDARQLMRFSPMLTDRAECPDLTLASNSISIHPAGTHVLCNTNAMTRWTVEPSKVDQFTGQLFYPEASIPSAGKTFDRWISPFSVHDFLDGSPSRSIFHSPGAPVPMSRILVSSANCSSPSFADWSLVLTYDKGIDPKKMSVIDVLPGAESASVPTSLSSEPITKWAASKDGERIAFTNASGLHVVSRQSWVCHTGQADAISIANLLKEGRLEQLEIAAEYLRSHKRLPRGIGGEELYNAIVVSTAERWRYINTTDQKELIKKIEDWHAKNSLTSSLVAAAMHLQLAAQARGEGFADSVSAENWQTVEAETSLAFAELDKVDFSMLQPAAADLLALNPGSLYEGAKVSQDQMLLDCTNNYPWDLDIHARCCLSCLPRWGGADRQIGAYIKELAAAYPPAEAERVYTRLVAYMRSIADEIDGEEFGFDFVRMTAGLRAMMKDGSLHQSTDEQAFYACQRKTHDTELMKELADYHVAHFNLVRSTVFAAASDVEIYKARNRAYYGTENP